MSTISEVMLENLFRNLVNIRGFQSIIMKVAQNEAEVLRSRISLRGKVTLHGSISFKYAVQPEGLKRGVYVSGMEDMMSRHSI